MESSEQRKETATGNASTVNVMITKWKFPHTNKNFISGD